MQIMSAAYLGKFNRLILRKFCGCGSNIFINIYFICQLCKQNHIPLKKLFPNYLAILSQLSSALHLLQRTKPYVNIMCLTAEMTIGYFISATGWRISKKTDYSSPLFHTHKLQKLSDRFDPRVLCYNNGVC